MCKCYVQILYFQVTEIDYHADKAFVKTASGETFTAEKVLVFP